MENRKARTAEEERVVGVTRRVRLRLEERVEVPEAALDVAVRRHLLEAEKDHQPQRQQQHKSLV